MEYALILAAVLLISPFVLHLAASQNKKTKQNLKILFLGLLSLQILSGFLNWENFAVSGRSGFELAQLYPGSLLGLFFIVSLLQMIFLILNQSLNTAVVVLNFINSVLIFAGMIRVSNILGYQAVSFTSITTVFLVLIGNVVALAFINKDKNIFKKYIRG